MVKYGGNGYGASSQQNSRSNLDMEKHSTISGRPSTKCSKAARASRAARLAVSVGEKDDAAEKEEEAAREELDDFVTLSDEKLIDIDEHFDSDSDSETEDESTSDSESAKKKRKKSWRKYKNKNQQVSSCCFHVSCMP